jgi:ATP-dependent DNA helicase RecQ
MAIGTEHSRAEWKVIGRELVRLGYLRQLAEKFNLLQLTDKGQAALKKRESIHLSKPMTAPKPAKHRAGEISCDEALFDRLRRVRKMLADRRGVPPYIVFSDVSLRQMARFYPSNEEEFARINGVGERKLKEFSGLFIAEIAAYRRANPTQSKKRLDTKK